MPSRLSGAALALACTLLAGEAVAQYPAPQDDPDLEASVREACSQCHEWPPPHILPRDMWRLRIPEMAKRSLLGTGLAPGVRGQLWKYDLDRVTRYYTSRAPATLPAPDAWPAPGPDGFPFERHRLRPASAIPGPAISNVRFLDLEGDERPELVACDMDYGVVLYGRPYEEGARLEVAARVPNPSHASAADLDGDGLTDLLIADLGDFLPSDHERGSVVWLRQTAPGAFEAKTLIAGLPRVADVEAADFDGDGDLDLIVAAFGWLTVGSTDFYENRTDDYSKPEFVAWPVDARAGAIHVPIADLDRDGNQDFVALISQQHEKVVAFLGLGPDGGFRPRTIFSGPFPAWGSSGIELTDLDGDGDLDVLMTNGDTLDDDTVKPYHGIRWLENEGDFPWVRHDLASLPGVHRAQAGDLDGDGDMDVVASAFLPDPERKYREFGSLVWLEQVEGRFHRHTLEAGRLTHTTLDLADYDADGDLDIAVGNFDAFSFSSKSHGLRSDAWVDVWENRSPGTTREVPSETAPTR